MNGNIVFALTLICAATVAGCERKSSSVRSASGVESGHVVAPLEMLRKASDSELEDMIFAAMRSALRGKENEDATIADWSAGLQMLNWTSELEAEVNNGGFHQYFWNTEGKHADAALRGFRLISATKHAELTQRAINRQASYQQQMERLRGEGSTDAFAKSAKQSGFDPLDKEFFGLDEKLHDLRIRYIRAHSEEFAIE